MAFGSRILFVIVVFRSKLKKHQQMLTTTTGRISATRPETFQERKAKIRKDFLSAQLADTEDDATVATGPESTPHARRIVRG